MDAGSGNRQTFHPLNIITIISRIIANTAMMMVITARLMFLQTRRRISSRAWSRARISRISCLSESGRSDVFILIYFFTTSFLGLAAEGRGQRPGGEGAVVGLDPVAPGA